MSQSLARNEGILTGISGGATMWAAVETAKKAPEGSVLVAMVSNDIYWDEQNEHAYSQIFLEFYLLAHSFLILESDTWALHSLRVSLPRWMRRNLQLLGLLLAGSWSLEMATFMTQVAGFIFIWKMFKITICTWWNTSLYRITLYDPCPTLLESVSYIIFGEYVFGTIYLET